MKASLQQEMFFGRKQEFISRCNSPSSVLVQIGSMYEFSLRLKRAKVEIEGSASCSGSHPQGEPQVGISTAFSSEYDIDWCKFRLVSEIFCESRDPMCVFSALDSKNDA